MEVVDALAMVGPSLFGPGQTPDEIRLRAADRPAAQIVITAARPPEYHLEPANLSVLQVCRSDPGQFVGLARIDPNQRDAVDQLRRAYELGFAGVFLHPAEEHCAVTSGPALTLLEANAGIGRPVVIAAGHPWFSEAPQLEDLAERFPSVAFVLTSGGQINVSGLGQFEVLQAMARRPNLYLHTTGVYRQDFLEKVATEFGAHRLMFAGGSPVFDPRFELMRVLNLSVSDEAREQIAAGTARTLFRS